MKKFVNLDTIFAIILILLLSSSISKTYAQADTIFHNPITGTNPGNTNPYTTNQTKNANITVSGIGRNGLSPNSGNNRYNATNWPTGDNIDTGKYFVLTLTPNSGYEIDFSSLVFTGQGSANNAPTFIEIRSSVDGYTSSIGAPAISNSTNLNTIDLTATSFQNITSAISFRIYAWKAKVGGTYSINDFTFTGAVVSTTPTITLSSLTDNSYCINATTSIDASFTATGMSSPSYVLELSDNAGSFTSATSLATGTTSPLTGSIAANTYTAGTGYKVRIRETTTGTVSNTIDVAMLAAPTGSITDVNPNVCYGLPAKVKFTTTSTASPFSLMIGTTPPGTAYTGIINNDEITVESSATSAKTYSLYKITDANGCITD